eukprot:273981_1
MGCVASTQQESEHLNLDEKINILTKQQDNTEAKKYKLLLLGAGQSGKSTLLRQIRRFHGIPFSESELHVAKQHLTQNVIESMRTLAIYSDIFYDQGYDTKVNEENEEIRKRVARMSDKQKFTRQHYEDLTTLWNDEHIKNMLQFSHTFQLSDTCRYLFDQMDNYWRDEYIPTFEDLIHVHMRKWGVNKIKFELSNAYGNETYEIFDCAHCGDIRRGCRKWVRIHCFGTHSTIIFIVALSGYNQTLMEDWYSDTNRMKEAIGLFR